MVVYVGVDGFERAVKIASMGALNIFCIPSWKRYSCPSWKRNSVMFSSLETLVYVGVDGFPMVV